MELIIRSHNDYLIAVKGNQKTLRDRIRRYVDTHRPLDSSTREEKNRGRIERRHVAIYNRPARLAPQWASVQRVVFVHRTGFRPKEGHFDEKHYYILSRRTNRAREIERAIRGHWFIENKLHHVKDVFYGEDKCGIADGKSAAILSLVQDMAINLFRCKGYGSVKKATIHFANKVKELRKFLTANHISDL